MQSLGSAATLFGFLICFLAIEVTTVNHGPTLEKILNVRKVQSTSQCGIVLMSPNERSNGSDLRHFKLDIALNLYERISHGFQHFVILSSTSGQEKTSSWFRFSFPCIHVVYEKVSSTSITPEWLKKHLFSRPAALVHFIFIDTEAKLLDLFNQPNARHLKYKTGLSYSNSIVTDDRGSPQVSLQVGPLPSGRGLFFRREIKAQYFSVEPNVVLGSNGQAVPKQGISYNLALSLSQKYNFSFTSIAQVRPMNQWPNGTWRGGMYDITEGDTDLFFCLVSILNRFKAADFTTNVYATAVAFYTSHPEVAIKWQAILYPLALDTWIAVGVALVVCTLVLYLQLTLNTHRGFQRVSDPLWHSLSLLTSAMLQQSFTIPREAKFLTVIFTFFALITGTAYNSNLISFLTFPDPEQAPRTFEELTNNERYDINLYHNPGGAASVFLKASKNPMHMKLHSRVNFELNTKKCTKFSAVIRRYACITYDIHVMPFVASNLTLFASWVPVVRSSDDLISFPMVGFLRKNSRYLTEVDATIGVVRDAGLVLKWQKDVEMYNRFVSRPWMRHLVSIQDETVKNLTLAIERSQTGQLKPFTLQNFVLCFVVFAVGLLIASIGFAAEMGFGILRYLGFLRNGFRKSRNVLTAFASSLGKFISHYLCQNIGKIRKDIIKNYLVSDAKSSNGDRGRQSSENADDLPPRSNKHQNKLKRRSFF